MIDKIVEVSITNTYLRRLRLHSREYEWTYYGGLISNDGTNILYLIFKSINPATSISFFKLKY